MVSTNVRRQMADAPVYVTAFVLTLLVTPLSAQGVPEPEEYRGKPYRAPVPDTLAGATVLTTETAHRIWETRSAHFIDVLPRLPKPDKLPEGTVWRDKPRDSIPGSIWLPNVGYQSIPEIDADYFRKGLEKVTAGETSDPVVIFCRADCWMSWNAAKRAIEFGYTDIHWFPDGTDGWRAAGYQLERVKPEAYAD
ncbi:MAG: PQQ-dependent catabolism-associated CXXCW motif protein [Roseibium sp.]|uniref:PQQ-dependent catabolism-associated CXXCW motif protein n=1 Tax=Roseibium sp. TaxID=1936156 RepID=UPI003D9C3589